MPYGRFGTAREAVKSFIGDHVMAISLSVDPPKVLNILDQFNSFLQENEFGKLRASEETQKQEDLIQRHLDNELKEWKALGVPTLIDYVENNKNVLVTWRHSSFQQRYIDHKHYESAKFVSVYNWLLSLHEREFLFACALYLKLLKCDPIYITDGKGDGGIDCIGRVNEGPFRSIFVYVQSKTTKDKNKQFSLNTLRQEYSKYSALKKSEKYLEYRKRLLDPDGRDGSGEVYVFFANTEFNSEAKNAASDLGIILRSIRQMAFFLSLAYNIEDIKNSFQNVSIPTEPDLNKNLSEEINISLLG